MKITRLQLDGALLIEGVRHGDARGWFEEIWSAPQLSAAGFDQQFVQDNVSFSAHANTLRGLHCQTPPASQGKLVGVLSGAVRDVIADLRPDSQTYLQHIVIDLDARRPLRLFVPEGFLHGYITREPDTLVHYKTTCAFSPDHDRSIAWNDPDLAIDWDADDPIVSDKDARAPRLGEAGPLFSGGA
jgi:dTDP-4-dehydrorhamnose 3,5-epimerase